MYNKIYTYIIENKLLYNKQFGFQNNNSTEHAILNFVDDINNAFHRRECTLDIFIDLSKAFDTVDHHILLQKLKSYRIRNTYYDWFKSYLSNRKQFIVLNDKSTLQVAIKCGVPQGSILGPLLFLLYVNDLPKAYNRLTSIMFADDTNLFLSHRNHKTLFQTANREL